jgi:hypothetical protein
MQGEMR